MNRRDFIKRSAAGAAGMWAASGSAKTASSERPNILWITCEDMGPDLGCFGESFAVTPNLDRLAAEGVRYTGAFAHAPVCAPARSGLITGMYPPSLGSHHMRSRAVLPESVRCFTHCLREAGYYCSNNHKEDYNFDKPGGAWDESSRKAHWRNRAPGQPFFSVFNLTTTHESQIRLSEEEHARKTSALLPHERHAPDKTPIPPYHPDTPEFRKNWAQYHDMITVMDKEAGALLEELAQAGLAENTIVFFFSDHGAGMPRCKRWLYDSGLHVPLIIRVPEKFRSLAPSAPDTAVDRLVSFVDFGPTVLSLAGAPIPDVMQGRAFLGPQAGAPRQYVYAGRDRMDERYDCVRAVRDARYKYIRNLMPHLSRGQFQEYMYHMPAMQAWARLAGEGRLEGPPALFMQPTKPVEELYDLDNDPHELNNLAEAPEHAETRARMRAALADWMRDTRDLGLLPESEMHLRAQDRSFYELARDPDAYPLDALLTITGIAGGGWPDKEALLAGLSHSEATVRYWAVLGLHQLPGAGVDVLEAVKEKLEDVSPAVSIAAAALLHQHGDATGLPVLLRELNHPGEWVRLQAANIVDLMEPVPQPAVAIFRARLNDDSQYVTRVARHAVQAPEETQAP